jgi:hypothetical protein
MTNTPAIDRGRPRMTKRVWLAGVVVLAVVWAVIVGSVGWASGRTAEVAGDGQLLAPFTLGLIAWTGVWLSGVRGRDRT